MIDLALHSNGEPVQCRDIAARQEIPEPYLNQLLSAMRRARLVASRRGPGGGHQLARPAAAITLAEIVDALDGSGDEAWSGGKGADTSCASALREVWHDVGQRAREVINQTTLAELADRVRERAHSYSI
jgi:Rrf2 family transcriptional regulator, iron-sulfur cluster assembly transcription factor